MAVNLTTTDRVSFGDVSQDAGLTAITVALTVNISSLVNNERFASHWGNSVTENAWILAARTSDNILFGVAADSSIFKIYKTNTNDVTGLCRIVATWSASLDEIAIWVNGVSKSTTAEVVNAPTALVNSPTSVEVGSESDEAVDAVDGDYSEFAMWDHKVPDWVCVAYGNGYSPNVYRSGGILYSRMLDTTDINDLWLGRTGTGSGAANAAHPRMFYPKRRQIYHVTAGAVAGLPVNLLRGNSLHSPLLRGLVG